jgi:putative two-component system response regulator
VYPALTPGDPTTVSMKTHALTKRRVLIVHDGRPGGPQVARQLETIGYETLQSTSGRRALGRLSDGIDLILVDALLPDMDGCEMIRRLRRDPEHHDIPAAMMISRDDRLTRRRAAEAGVDDFLTRPVDRLSLRVRTAALMKIKSSQDAVKRQRSMLEATVQKRTASMIRALKDTAEAQRMTHRAHLDTVQRLAMAAEYKDRQTAVHIHRMSRYCAVLGRGLRLPANELDLLCHASPLHDVGKIGIPDSILLKPGRLDSSEWDLMREHTNIGARILDGSRSKLLQTGLVIARTHHERWDGSGYPRGLSGESIPLSGRICAVADVYDALTSHRPYKTPIAPDKSFDIIQDEAGKHFDPRIVSVFLERRDEIREIQVNSSKAIRRWE